MAILSTAMVVAAVAEGGTGPTEMASSRPTIADDWTRMPGNPLADCADNFERAGYTPVESVRLAHIALFGLEPDAGEKGCDYYLVTTYTCENGSRRYRRATVGTVCIEAFLPSCPSLSCPPGQRTYFKVNTAAGCDPSAACAWVEISGPFTSSVASVCDGLASCSCWPELGCEVRECVPLTSGPSRPAGCPSCE